MAELTVGLERWGPFWPEAAALAAKHSIEVDTGVEPRRKFQVDTEMMALMDLQGSLRIVAARAGGELVGYFTWTLSPDIESKGLLIALQGAWYVLPGHPKAAVRMFDYSVEMLKGLGVECIFPHHRTQGRGHALGKFFRRRGAKLIQHSYCLWIGD